MVYSRAENVRIIAAVASLAVLAAGLALGLSVSRAEDGVGQQVDDARQVTVFAVIATPEGKGTDSKLSPIKPQLERLLPRHGFKILDVQTKRLLAGEGFECDLSRVGYVAKTSLIQPDDENGKVEIRCELWSAKVRQFSTQVRTPPNQLFFCERALKDGTRLLLGVGAR